MMKYKFNREIIVYVQIMYSFSEFLKIISFNELANVKTHGVVYILFSCKIINYKSHSIS